MVLTTAGIALVILAMVWWIAGVQPAETSPHNAGTSADLQWEDKRLLRERLAQAPVWLLLAAGCTALCHRHVYLPVALVALAGMLVAVLLAHARWQRVVPTGAVHGHREQAWLTVQSRLFDWNFACTLLLLASAAVRHPRFAWLFATCLAGALALRITFVAVRRRRRKQTRNELLARLRRAGYDCTPDGIMSAARKSVLTMDQAAWLVADAAARRS